MIADTSCDLYRKLISEHAFDSLWRPVGNVLEQINTAQSYWTAIMRYARDFVGPYLTAVNYFGRVESGRLLERPPWESWESYLELLKFNFDLSQRGLLSSIKAINNYSNMEMQKAVDALLNTLFRQKGEDLQAFWERQARVIRRVSRDYPQAIVDIEPEYGFHFERGNDVKFAETERFLLYRITPTHTDVTVEKNRKPVIIIPPYVLGANILAFLPGEDRSYTHAFANQGIPVYIRIMKDIHEHEAVQVMTPEDDTLDTRFFCEKVKAEHGQAVTLNGYCQGGFSAVCSVLAGELDGLVDALLTCVSPMDGTRSKGLAHFLQNLPHRFNDLAYGTKTLPNGNKVADGDLMGWVYKLKSIENEAPLVAFYRDMMMFGRNGIGGVPISKTAAALNYWLKNERTDLPLDITRVSFQSYNTPISADGTLPVKLFGRELNFKRIQDKGLPWLICYGERDELVEKETALAPLDYIDAEIAGFPKGHVAIATSWSHPDSECALHTRFGEANYRGPVRFHLDLEAAASKRSAS